MTAPPPDTIRLHEHGDLIAAIPHLLGFHPRDSLVAVAVADRSVALTLRCNLVDAAEGGMLAAQLTGPLLRQCPTGVMLLAVGGTAPDPPPGSARGTPPWPPPCSALVAEVGGGLETAGLPVLHAAWAAATQRDAPWQCYVIPDCAGTVPDPAASAVGAATVAAGLVTFDDRAELARLLAPDPAELLARRSAAMDAAVRRGMATRIARRPDRALAAVQRAVRDAGHGSLPTDDSLIVKLALGLVDRRVRDASLLLCLGEQATAAGALWLALVRSVPEPERADPATLLAITSYVRGEGALAGMALDAAMLADPQHRLAALVQQILDAGVSPADLEAVMRAAGDEATAAVTEQRPVSNARRG